MFSTSTSHRRDSGSTPAGQFLRNLSLTALAEDFDVKPGQLREPLVNAARGVNPGARITERQQFEVTRSVEAAILKYFYMLSEGNEIDAAFTRDMNLLQTVTLMNTWKQCSFSWLNLTRRYDLKQELQSQKRQLLAKDIEGIAVPLMLGVFDSLEQVAPDPAKGTRDQVGYLIDLAIAVGKRYKQDMLYDGEGQCGDLSFANSRKRSALMQLNLFVASCTGR